MIASSSIKNHYWGLLSYEEADLLQVQAWQSVKAGSPGIILGGEIQTVITQGIRARTEHVLAQGLKPVQTRRGGETTLHSPGQLVIYPVVSLKEQGLGVKAYVENLLKVSEMTYHEFQIPVEMRWEPLGLWTLRGKMGFCGVQVKAGITQHGLALNITNDLSLFSQIVSCGLSNAQYDKAQNYNPLLNPEAFFIRWVENFRAVSQLETWTPGPESCS